MTSTATEGSAPAQSDAALREQLSSLQGLLVLSMLMTERGDEDAILELTASSVPSIGQCRLHGVHLAGEGWRMAEGSCARPEVQADLEAQLVVLSSAGGALGVLGEGWGWAFPLRSLQGHFGHLVVAAKVAPAAPRQFLLRMLAQQTGIALANARLHARERKSADDLRSANLNLAETVELLERSTAIHDRLTRTAAAGEGQIGIAQAVHELTGYAVAAEDRHGNLRAWAGPGKPGSYPKASPSDREALLRRVRRAGAPVRHGDRLVAIAGPRNDALGVLALIDPDSTAGEPEQVALEHGATVLAMELARLRGLAEIELRVRRDLVDDLLAGTDEESALARAGALGYDLERPHRVVVVETRGGAREDEGLFAAVRRAARSAGVGSLLVARGGEVVLLADADCPWGRLQEAVEEDIRGGGCRIGVGGTCASPADFPRSHREARFALGMVDPWRNGDQAVTFDGLGVYRILASMHDTAAVERFVREWLGRLLDYDGQGRAELVTTLSRYLECGRNHEATARALSIHRSTLKYRLRRIAEISGLDLSSPDVQFNLQLATRGWRTLVGLRTRRG